MASSVIHTKFLQLPTHLHYSLLSPSSSAPPPSPPLTFVFSQPIYTLTLQTPHPPTYCCLPPPSRLTVCFLASWFSLISPQRHRSKKKKKISPGKAQTFYLLCHLTPRTTLTCFLRVSCYGWVRLIIRRCTHQQFVSYGRVLVSPSLSRGKLIYDGIKLFLFKDGSFIVWELLK